MKVLVLNGSPKGEKGNNQAVYGLLFVLEQNTRQMCYKGRYAENLRKD